MQLSHICAQHASLKSLQEILHMPPFVPFCNQFPLKLMSAESRPACGCKIGLPVRLHLSTPFASLQLACLHRHVSACLHLGDQRGQGIKDSRFVWEPKFTTPWQKFKLRMPCLVYTYWDWAGRQLRASKASFS
eukprot:1142190-Pelagomonas_calceolata.AAC.10